MDLNVLSFMNDVVLPIFIVVFLPVVIVLIVQIFRNRNLARKTDVIKLAIEKGANLDVNKMIGTIVSIVGAGLLTMFFVGRKMLPDDKNE